MDPAPNCAICNAPAYPECSCESERLQIAVKQAEKRAMEGRLAEIRLVSRIAHGLVRGSPGPLSMRPPQHGLTFSSRGSDWVISHAREQILHGFERLTSARKSAHATYLSSLPYYTVYMQYSGHPPL